MPINTPENIAAADAEKRYSRGRILSNLSFFVGSLFVFISLWYIGAKDTPLDPLKILESITGTGQKEKKTVMPWQVPGLELTPIDRNTIPEVFLTKKVENTPVESTDQNTPDETPATESKESKLKKELEAANHLFRSRRWTEAEDAYVAIIKQLSDLRALELQRRVSVMFYENGVKFFYSGQYKNALKVLRIAIHFDAKNKLAHTYTAKNVS